MRPIGVMRNGTKIALSVCANQLSGKQKHYREDYAPGQKQLEGWFHFVLSRTLDRATQLYHASFNEHYNQPRDAVVALYKNANHNHGITYILSPKGVFLDKNFTLSPENKANLTFVASYFQTAYNFIEL